MSDSIVTQTTGLSQLAKRINEEHAKAEAAMRDGLSHAVEAGKLLIEAKTQHKHGGWLKWLTANFASTPRTAQNYMYVTKRILDEEKAKRVSHLGFRQAIDKLRSEEGILDRKARHKAWLEETAKYAEQDHDTGEVREQDFVVTEERRGLEGWLYRVTRGGLIDEYKCIDPEYLELKRTEMDEELSWLVANATEGLSVAQQALGDLAKHCRQHGTVHEDLHTVDQWDGLDFPCAVLWEACQDLNNMAMAVFGVVDEKLKAEAEAIMAEWGIPFPGSCEQDAELEAVG